MVSLVQEGDAEGALHTPESSGTRVGARIGAVALEQLPELRFRGRGRCANQSVE